MAETTLSTKNASARNFRNAMIAILAPLPSILFYLSFLRRYSATATDDAESLSPLWSWCYHHPLLLANVLFFVNVDLLFWLVGLLQSSHWMIDIYWTIIPVMLVHYFSSHPLLAKFNYWRSTVVIILTSIWSMRLMHSYFRREKWQWGAREDWRFSDMRQQYGQNWWWVSLFAIYTSQQAFLMGVCVPLYFIHTVDQQLNIWDLLAATVCLSGITLAYFADTQLHKFVTRNEELKKLGETLVPILDTGLWRFSRHPNYFGEQLWWWGLAIFAWNLGYGWALVNIGGFVNTACLAYVTVLVEERITKHEYRAEEYKQYQKSTSVWIPWFKKSLVEKQKQT